MRIEAQSKLGYYPTPDTQPLSTVRPDALGLGTPGVLTVGTLSDAPPSI